MQKLNQKIDVLRGGDWVGIGATKFYNEMDSTILPAFQRLARALERAQQATRKISHIMRRAEDECAALFRTGSSGIGSAAGAAAGAAAGGAAGAATTATHPMLSGFSPQVRQILSQLPTLTSQMQQLERGGWTIRQGRPGGGSTTDNTTKTITIDRSQLTNQMAAGIAHEVGHAQYGVPPYHPPTANMTRDQYIQQNVNEQLRNEGAAQFNAAQARGEVQRADGPDIGIPGSQTNAYQQVYNNYSNGSLTRDQAIGQMATAMGHETTSSTGQDYRQHDSSRAARDFFDGRFLTAGDLTSDQEATRLAADIGQTYKDFWDWKVDPTRRMP